MKNYQIQIINIDNTALDHLDSIESFESPRELFPPELDTPTASVLGSVTEIGHADGSWQWGFWKLFSGLF